MESVAGGHTLPTPHGTPYRTPTLSRRSREFEDVSHAVTPLLLSADDKITSRHVHETSYDSGDNLSPLDPRRFTPTLHASLVSEILNLRRELETKTKDIDRLEQNLHTAQTQTESLNSSLVQSNKDVRLVRRQMQLLEGGTLSAINDLSKERDDALRDASDLKRRLEASQKKAKNEEDNTVRIQKQLEKEREQWTSEKRSLETKVSVVEGRLRVVLSEVAHVQLHNTTADSGQLHSPPRQSRPGSPARQAYPDTRLRRQSATSVGSEPAGGRVSALSFTQGESTNLADELALEDIDESPSDDDSEGTGRISPDALPEERGRPASSLSIKARKVLGLPFDFENMENVERSQTPGVGAPAKPTGLQGGYVDAAVQHEDVADASTGRPMGNAIDGRQLSQHHGNRGNSPASQSLAAADMVSSSCQTVDSLPSPPLTPTHQENILATIHESVYERAETKDMATQTRSSIEMEAEPAAAPILIEEDNLHIPVISIVPPASRPVTPDTTVVLPPRTRNASCQADADVSYNYTSASMQTEEIRVDQRSILSVRDSLQKAPGGHRDSAIASKSGAQHRRGTSAMSNTALKRSAPPVPALPPVNDTGPLSSESANSKARPQRSSSMFAGFDDHLDEDVFEDDELFSRPTARFTLKSGKLISERALEDIGEVSAASAGAAFALSQLRQSEDALPAELRRLDERTQHPAVLKRTTTLRRGQSAGSRAASMRRVAMITNGTAAHQSKHSQSSMGSSESGMPPPIPIPLRYSSMKMGKSFSESGRNSRGSSTGSPTRQARSQPYRPGLRKTRSGPALSPAAVAARRHRSRSPPEDGRARISIVPEIPTFRMPVPAPLDPYASQIRDPHEASAPRPSVATGPSRTGHHVKSNSDAEMLQQTSVVDAIAQTMVGEWMFKYVRRRKSFGKIEKDWDPSKSADELINNPGSAGVRHKRWVWVAPYERAIMWSSKQPTNGAAAMGKTGRKLTIKSVLDVKDENPMPKGSLSGPPFNRSILVLTPQRALKFTATSQERHYVWLTALSFLSHSPISIGELAALPPPPSEPLAVSSPPPSMSGSFRRRTIRDSIRIAKAPSRSTLRSSNLATDDLGALNELLESRPRTGEYYDANSDAAMPPVVRRYHTRGRSNTAPKPPPNSFRALIPSFPSSTPGPPSSHYSQSGTERGSSEKGPSTPTFGNGSVPSTRRGSEASALGRSAVTEISSKSTTPFFDSNSSHNATMTMRMDAFIDGKQPPAKGGFRNLRLAGNTSRPGDRKPEFPSYGLDDSRNSISPIDTMSPVGSSYRVSDSTGHGSLDRDFYRAF